MLIREAIAQGSADLKYAGIKTPSLDASLLLAHVLNTNRSSLIAAGTKRLSEENCSLYCELIERRCNGECVAYITGKKEFMGLEFEVNPSVLVPRPDTETLVETAKELLQNRLPEKTRSLDRKIKILDLCTGSGAAAISLKNEMPELEVYASDISEEALETAKQNAARLLPGSIIHFYHGDLFNLLPSSGSSKQTGQSPLLFSDAKFDIIVSNPPYIPSDDIESLQAEVKKEPRIALDGGASGLEIIKRIVNESPDFLHCGGILLMEADPNQMEKIKILLENRGYNNIQFYNDLSGDQRVIGGMHEK
jgi:release factor glutamine methyltransferase